MLLPQKLTNLAKIYMLMAILIQLSHANGLFAQNWNEIMKATASDRSQQAAFGFSVAISGDYAIVGAFEEDEDASGGNWLNGAGSAYIFKNNAGTWTEVQKIVASDRATSDGFGSSVAISGDYAIVGAHTEDEDASGANTLNQSGSAYIFKNQAGNWTEVQKIVASDRDALDVFGFSVAISGDHVIVGAGLEDEDVSGANSISGAGSAYIFKNNTGTWTEVQKIVASERALNDHFANSVSISEDYAIIGAFQEDQDVSGADSLAQAGSAYIFKNNAGTWSEVQKIVASDRSFVANFGWFVAISGEYAIVGAPYERHDASGADSLNKAGGAYIFKNNAGTWAEVQKIVASDRDAYDLFGIAVAISGDYAIIGASDEDHDALGADSLSQAGSAYIFKNNAGTWTEVRKIVASDRDSNDMFASAVAISEDYAIVGAYFEDEDAFGANTLDFAGSVYFYKRNASVGIIENDFGDELLVYPNPTSGKFSVDLGTKYESVELSIFDVHGKIIQSKSYDQTQLITVSIDELSGIYLINLKTGDKKATVRLVKE